eukprot:GILJ01020082.1.p1 GENE.GILJ01020082.1~~GILJ01020082.1.p1  ORF type:complete len:162 (+),score=25.11 GILJ01020082.1:34-519(+)
MKESATLGKQTTGRKFQPVFPPDQRDHRVNQYTEAELEQFRLGERKMPDGPVVSDWRELEAQQEAAEAIAENKRRTAEREATRLASLHKDVSSLRESLESVKVRVEQEALGVEALKVREWEKLKVGDSYRGIECIKEECLPLGSPLKAVRQQRLLASMQIY